jgi:hypothetical protein
VAGPLVQLPDRIEEHGMERFILGLNEWSLVLVVTGTFVLFSFAILWVSYRFLPGLRFEKGSTDFGLIYGTAIGTIFALIFTFDTIAVWQNHDQLAGVVGQEATNLNNLYQNLDGYAPEFRDPLQQALKDYVGKVVGSEWALQAEGRDQQDPAARQQILDIYSRLIRYRPATEAQWPLHEQMLHLVAQNRILRLQRIRGGESYLDGTMWLSLGLGSLILLVFSCLLNITGRRGHYTMHAGLAFSLGLVCYLLLVYDHPFLGPGAIGPAPLLELTEKAWIAP